MARGMPAGTPTRPRGRSRSPPSTTRLSTPCYCPSSCRAGDPSFPDLLEQEHALLVGGHDIEQAVAVEVGDDELGADPALVVDLAWGENDLAVGGTARLEPVEAGRLVRAGLV